MVSMFLGSHADYQIAIFCLSLCTVYAVYALDYVFCDILPFASEGSFVMQLEPNNKLKIPAAYKNTQTMIHQKQVVFPLFIILTLLCVVSQKGILVKSIFE